MTNLIDCSKDETYLRSNYSSLLIKCWYRTLILIKKTAKVSKLLNGTGLDYYEMHSVMATLKFILENSITFNVNDVTLNKELIDLGLPKGIFNNKTIENV